jgi:hypothetical protein
VNQGRDTRPNDAQAALAAEAEPQARIIIRPCLFQVIASAACRVGSSTHAFSSLNQQPATNSPRAETPGRRGQEQGASRIASRSTARARLWCNLADDEPVGWVLQPTRSVPFNRRVRQGTQRTWKRRLTPAPTLSFLRKQESTSFPLAKNAKTAKSDDAIVTEAKQSVCSCHSREGGNPGFFTTKATKSPARPRCARPQPK